MILQNWAYSKPRPINNIALPVTVQVLNILASIPASMARCAQIQRPKYAPLAGQGWAGLIHSNSRHLTLDWWVYLRFSQCEQCFHFKETLADQSLSMEVRLGAIIEYRRHLASQYSDRCIIWNLQELSFDPLSDCIVCQTDGMDQGKFRVPRDPKLRATASLSTAIRPKLKVHGMWVFGAFDDCQANL